MISFLKGNCEVYSDNIIFLENNGVGYKIFCTNSVLNVISKSNSQHKVYTFLSVKQDELSLFGFSSIYELSLFEKLISVSGVGPKAGISLLNSLSPSKLSMAIVTSDVKMISTGQGIGKKTAERIILELKDKVNSIEYLENSLDDSSDQNLSDNSNRKDAIEALEVLGFSKIQAFSTVNSIKQNLKTEEIISLALKMLSGGDFN